MYLSLSGTIRAGTGGQTRALLMRNRLFTEHAGVGTTIVTFDTAPVYPSVREALTARQELVDGMRLLNIYEWYRCQDLDDEQPLDEAVPAVDGFDAEDVPHPDGTVYYTRHVHPPSRAEALREYRRRDGSVFLRAPAPDPDWVAPATSWVLFRRDGLPVARWDQRRGWHKRWLRSLADGADRVFVISDSRFALADVIPMRDPRFHVLHLMHNTHTVGRRRWDSPLSGQYEPLLTSIRHLDGLVTLTRRQLEDVAQRYGTTDNLFVVPNPVELPNLPSPMPPREPATFAVVSRLERQKRLDHAVRAFAEVVQRRPHARLLIYGDGQLRLPLTALVRGLGLDANIQLMGHDPHARSELLTATGFLLTSGYEGYPLATLESMSFGCPVVSYDIKYGPREQVTDGVDGFLVPAGDVHALAERIVRMIDDPPLVARLSEGALRKAQQHGPTAFLHDWRRTLERAIVNKPTRVRIRPQLTVHELGWQAPPRRLRRGSRPVSAGFGSSRRLVVRATVAVEGQWRRGALDRARLSLDAVSDDTGATSELPLQVTRAGPRFELRSDFDLADAFASADTNESVRLRLRLVVSNVAWQTELARAPGAGPRFEVSYDERGRVLLHQAGVSAS